MPRYEIDPVSAPRQVRSDTWAPSLHVRRYRAFKDHVRRLGVQVRAGDRVTFVLAMPRSWSKTKRAQMDGRPHQQKPDVDNLLKALWDAVEKDDSHLDRVCLAKVWGVRGAIEIEPEEDRHARTP